MKSRPTKADVARMANVSTATVSYVLNNSVGRTISAQTRAAVQNAAAELGYRPNLAARNLARGKSGVVLYIVPRLAGGEMPMQVGTHMTTELTRRGIMQVQLFETEHDDTVADAINHLQPIAVTSLFPLGRKATSGVQAAPRADHRGVRPHGDRRSGSVSGFGRTWFSRRIASGGPGHRDPGYPGIHLNLRPGAL